MHWPLRNVEEGTQSVYLEVPWTAICKGSVHLDDSHLHHGMLDVVLCCRG